MGSGRSPIRGPPRSTASHRTSGTRHGGSDPAALVAQADRGTAVTAMSEGAREVLRRLHADGRVDAVFGMGGGAGTTVATAAMRALPLGLPKVMVSTLASGDVRGFVG